MQDKRYQFGRVVVVAFTSIVYLPDKDDRLIMT